MTDCSDGITRKFRRKIYRHRYACNDKWIFPVPHFQKQHDYSKYQVVVTVTISLGAYERLK